MLKKTFGFAVLRDEITKITVEVEIERGVGYHFVGLADNAIKESNYRIAAALLSYGYRIPNKKITIPMTPVDLPKEGSAYDLTLAMGILAASGQIKSENIDRYIIMGELSLEGSLQPIDGVLSIAIKAKEDGFIGLILPIDNAKEAAEVSDLNVYGVDNIKQVIKFFNSGEPLKRTIVDN